MKLAILLLAAGGSTRMGAPKQLLSYHGESLVRRAARILTLMGDVFVVTGNASDRVSQALHLLPVRFCENPDWQRGIGTSIRRGVNAIRESMPSADAILIALADQPLVPVEHFQALAAAYTAENALIASGYAGSPGVPAIFGKPYFDQLAQLPDDRGAKSILTSAHQVPLNQPLDIDTPEDYQRLINPSE